MNIPGLVVSDATDEGLNDMVEKHPEVKEFQLGSKYTFFCHSAGSYSGLQDVLSLPNLTSIEIKRKMKPMPVQLLTLQSTYLTTLGLYNMNIPETSILSLLDSCTSNLRVINFPLNKNITDLVLLKIFKKFGNSLKTLDLSRTKVTGDTLSGITETLPKITELTFCACYELTDTGLLNLVRLGGMTLVIMNIVDARMITGEKLMEYEGTLPCLETFHFYGNGGLTDKGKISLIC